MVGNQSFQNPFMDQDNRSVQPNIQSVNSSFAANASNFTVTGGEITVAGIMNVNSFIKDALCATGIL
ncbi:hypothetical protein GYMLUDRAFT_935062 [Collybiopsis luxurians FD-317 M1]|nr:hypothetical protein GYMLUDRAFT_935062 [Collybiopsis luxurians FD-317 M1]